MSILPASFVLSVGQTKQFDLSAFAKATPARNNETTVVEIGFYVDGLRIDSATQFLYYEVGAAPALQIAPVPVAIPPTGDSNTPFLWIALFAAALGLSFVIAWKRRSNQQ